LLAGSIILCDGFKRTSMKSLSSAHQLCRKKCKNAIRCIKMSARA
jgi:hypothetical protein